jgi:hypothetical protein
MAKVRKLSSVTSSSSADEGLGLEYRDRVAMRAYELYLARGGADGRDFDDWLAAERELSASNGDTERGDEAE